MDVAAVRSDELTRARLTAAAVSLLLTALAVLAAVQAVHRSDRARSATAVTGALAAARLEALNLTTIDYRTARRDLLRIVDGATGSLRQQFATEVPHASVLAADRSRSVGQVLSAGLIRVDPDVRTARVVLAVDAEVSATPAGASASAAATRKHYRMVMTLRRVGGRWLAADVAFAGVPQ